MAARYDVAVIGGGLAGLTAGAVLARAGKRVLVAEQGESPGGYASSFRRGPYVFDPAVHVMPDGGEGGFMTLVLDHLGVRDRCDFLPLDAFYGATLPGLSVMAPVGYEAFVEAQTAAFPQAADDIRSFYRLCFRIHEEAHTLPPRLGLRELDEAAGRFPTLFAYLKATVAEVLEAEIADERARAACAAFWPYPGQPPSRLSIVTFAQTLAVHMLGSYYARGSFQSLADALAAAIELHGSELALGARVTRVLVEDGRARGIVLADGAQVEADAVVSASAARRTLLELVGEEHLPAPYLARLRRMEPAYSVFVLFAATRADLAALPLGHQQFLFRRWDHAETYRDMLAGRPAGIWLASPTLVDQSVAPAGEHAVTLSSLALYDRDWEAEKDAFAAALLGELEAILPALAGEVEIVDAATPRTFERYTLNEGGAISGWANTPPHTGSKRLPPITPIRELYLTGHWTQPGSSGIRALLSGVQTAGILLRRAGEEPPDLGPP